MDTQHQDDDRPLTTDEKVRITAAYAALVNAINQGTRR
jgi:hypothetical protein